MSFFRKNAVILSVITTIVLLAFLFLFLFTKPIIFYKARNVYEYKAWSDFESSYSPSEQDESALNEVTVTFNGVHYTGEYINTISELPYPFKLHFYQGDKVSFYVSAKTGELIKINLNSSEKTDYVEQNHLIEMADGIAGEYIELSKYKFEYDVLDNYYSDFPDQYVFEYYREIGGMKTADGLKIVIDQNGNIIGFKSYVLGSFKREVYIKKLNEKKAEKTLDKEVQKLFSHIKENGSTEYEILETLLIKTPNGRIGFLYKGHACYITSYTTEDGNTDERRTPADLYVIIT